MESSDVNNIIQLVLQGNISAFEKLVYKYQDIVFTLAFRMLKNREEAEEVAQDVFVKVFRSLNQYEQRSRFSTWLYKITYHTSINHLRKQKNKIETTELNNSSNHQVDFFSDPLEAEEEKNIIRNALFSLPENDRIILTLYYFDEIPVKEIAEITELTESNVKTRLFRSRQKLHEILSDQKLIIPSLTNVP